MAKFIPITEEGVAVVSRKNTKAGDNGQQSLFASATTDGDNQTDRSAPAAKKIRATNTKPRKRETAESMGARQQEISVSEFFSKNRHLLGFDSPRKALLTAIKEAVDNSLDACEEADILPDIIVEIEDLGKDRFRISIEDNGPGIVKKHIPNIFGKLLYGSKFHRLKMSRGQQGIGISAAGMYGMLTTGKPVEIISRTAKNRPAYFFHLRIDTKKNKPEIISEEEIEWEPDHGTRVSIELTGKYQRGRQSVDEYLRQTAIANPHVQIVYSAPGTAAVTYARSTDIPPPHTKEIKPHPLGIELGVMQSMIKNTKARNLAGFFQSEFSRITAKVAEEICANAKLSPRGYPSRITRDDVERIMAGIQATRIMNPPTNCVAPIGEEQLIKGLEAVVPADFYASTTRPPAVYRGNPFIIEAALAWGGGGQEGDSPARLLRLANRVPLLHQQGACCAFSSTTNVNWRLYNLSQPRGSLPVGPLTIVVHMASVWVPFTSESKEAIAGYPEIQEQIMRALQDCGRKLRIFLSKRRKALDFEKKQNYIETYIPHIGIGLRDLIGLSETDEKNIVEQLTGLLERAKE